MTKNEFKELTGEDPEDILGGDFENEIEEMPAEEKEEIINDKIKMDN